MTKSPVSPKAAAKKQQPIPCPVCKKASVPDFHPFCSKKCSLIDLGNWLQGSYAIPTEDSSEEPLPGKED